MGKDSVLWVLAILFHDSNLFSMNIIYSDCSLLCLKRTWVWISSIPVKSKARLHMPVNPRLSCTLIFTKKLHTVISSLLTQPWLDVGHFHPCPGPKAHTKPSIAAVLKTFSALLSLSCLWLQGPGPSVPRVIYLSFLLRKKICLNHC